MAVCLRGRAVKWLASNNNSSVGVSSHPRCQIWSFLDQGRNSMDRNYDIGRILKSDCLTCWAIKRASPCEHYSCQIWIFFSTVSCCFDRKKEWNISQESWTFWWHEIAFLTVHQLTEKWSLCSGHQVVACEVCAMFLCNRQYFHSNSEEPNREQRSSAQNNHKVSPWLK